MWRVFGLQAFAFFFHAQKKSFFYFGALWFLSFFHGLWFFSHIVRTLKYLCKNDIFFVQKIKIEAIVKLLVFISKNPRKMVNPRVHELKIDMPEY